MNRKLIISFAVGLLLGAVGMLIGQPFIGKTLPQAVRGKQEVVSGHVTAKRLDQDRLLLTVVTPEGATLATFTSRVNEIELLVERGDTVTLAMPEYHPFLSDPEIARVVKPSGLPAAPAAGGLPLSRRAGWLRPFPRCRRAGRACGCHWP